MTAPAPLTLGSRFVEAMQLAIDLHKNDVRKGKQTPFVAHLLGVCALVLQDGGTEEEAIAALLHDSLEDHPESISSEEIARRFGSDVLSIVRSCSDTPADFEGGEKAPWKQRKDFYLEHLEHAEPGARRVSLADKVYNGRELLSDLQREKEATWDRFNAGRDEQLWYYRSILERMKTAGQRGALMEEFERLVQAIQAEASNSSVGGLA